MIVYIHVILKLVGVDKIFEGLEAQGEGPNVLIRVYHRIKWCYLILFYFSIPKAFVKNSLKFDFLIEYSQ